MFYIDSKNVHELQALKEYARSERFSDNVKIETIGQNRYQISEGNREFIVDAKLVNDNGREQWLISEAVVWTTPVVEPSKQECLTCGFNYIGWCDHCPHCVKFRGLDGLGLSRPRKVSLTVLEWENVLVALSFARRKGFVNPTDKNALGAISRLIHDQIKPI